MKEQLQKLLQLRANLYVSNKRSVHFTDEKIERKKELIAKRNGEIVKTKALGKITSINSPEKIYYQAHFQHLIKQRDFFYLEEEVEHRVARFENNDLIEDKEIIHPESESVIEKPAVPLFLNGNDERQTFVYDRLAAVKYAERWWNDFNPAYFKFENDCTNFISQCLHAGGAPMWGYPDRNRGWWMMRQNWSYSWAVANALTSYLQHSKRGLRAKEVGSPEELMLGDVICYDFEGDGRFNHTTIVTGKDAFGMPLVNAHTANSRMRYWAYEDSTAYTPNIRYKFFHIVDDG